MNRQAIDNGHWFDLDIAESYEEDQWYDGHNFVSRATGNQWEHETLYYTNSGRWIVHHWSQWQGSMASWADVSAETAAAWLIANDHEPPASLATTAAELEL